jgi:hypothetical protein
MGTRCRAVTVAILAGVLGAFTAWPGPACAAPDPAEAGGCRLRLVNTSEHALAGEPVTIPCGDLSDGLCGGHIRVLESDGRAVHCQVDDLDGDGRPDELVFRADLPPRGTAVYRVEAGRSDTAAETDLEVRHGRILVNKRLRCEVSADGGFGLRIVDAATGTPIVERLRPSGAPKPVKTRVVARGPVRGIVAQTWENGGLACALRYTLMAGEGRVRVELVLANSTDEPKPAPKWLGKKGAFQLDQDEAITRDIADTDILSVAMFRSSRPNLLWVNRATDHALGLAYHSPHWRWYGPTLWAGASNTFDGVIVHSRTPPPGEAPVSGRHIHTDKHGSLDFGRLLAWPEEPKHIRFRRMWWKRGRPMTVPAGGRLTVGFTVCAYRGERDPVVRAFERDATTAAGAVTVLGAGGRVLVAARAPEHLNEPFDAADRWWTAEGTPPTVREGAVRLASDGEASGIRTTVHRDFADPTELRGRVASLADGAAVEVVLEKIETGKRHRLARIEKAGPFRVDVTEAVPSLFIPTACILHVALVPREATGSRRPWPARAVSTATGAETRREGSGEGVAARIDRLTLAWPTPPAPAVLGPEAGVPLTDIALSFVLESKAAEQCERGYEVEVAKDGGFNEPLRQWRFANVIRPSTSRPQPFRTYAPEELLPAGTYHARVRAVGVLGEPGPWGEAVRFRISGDDHTAREPVRPIGPREPLILIPPKKRPYAQAMWDALPERLRRLTAIGPSLEEIKEDPDGWLRKTRFPMMVRLSHNVTGHPDLAYLEGLMQACPRVIGFAYAESLFATRFAERNLVLAGKYGRYFGQISGGPGYGINQILPGAHEGFYGRLATHGRYFLPFMKSQNPYSPLAGYVNLVGLYLAGRPGQWAAETEYWMPKKLGLKDEKQAPVDWMPPLLMGLAYGAQAFRVETFISEKPCRGWDAEAGRFDTLWTRVLGPFFTDVVEEELIPTREEVRAGVRVVFQPGPEVGIAEARGVEHYPAAVVAVAHGIEEFGHQWIPDNPRVGIVPMLPVHATDAERERFAEVVRPETLKEPEAVREVLARHYPPTENEAFCVRSGDTGVVTNSIDDPKAARPQRFVLPLTKGPVREVRGTVAFHQYLVLKQREGSLFVHANHYADAATQVTLVGKAPLQVQVTPPEALARKENAGGGTVTLTLTHEHPAGAVRVRASGARLVE